MFAQEKESALKDAVMMNNLARVPIHIIRLCILLLPAALLAGSAMRDATEVNWILWMGSAFQLGICFLTYFNTRSWRQPLGPLIITLYLVGLGWLWFGTKLED